MKKRISLATVLIALLITALLTFLLTNSFVGKKYQAVVDQMDQKGEEFPSLVEIKGLIEEYYLGSVDHDAAQEALIRAYVASLGDKYSRYLNAEEYSVYNTSRNGAGFGIGVYAVWDEENGNLLVYSVFPSSPAEKAGIKKNDRVTRVGGMEVSEIGPEAAFNAFTGEEGSFVDIHAQRRVGGQTLDFDFSVERADIEIQSVISEMLENSIGYVQIFTFNEKTPEQFRTAVTSLTEKGAKALIFDLRDNAGGSLNSVVEMLDFILPEGDLVRAVDKNGNETMYKSGAESVDLPMAVLINSSSASASEIFAFAVRDFQKGVLVGETTYGKGTAQIILKMKDGGALILSNFRFYSPKGETPEGVGVKPDVEAALEEANFYLIPRSRDNQLKSAISVISERLGIAVPADAEPDETETSEADPVSAP